MPNVMFHLQIEDPYSDKRTIIHSMLESYDLWTRTTSLGGSFTWAESYVSVNSGTTLNGLARLTRTPSAPPYNMTWTKKRTLRFSAEIRHANDANSEVYMGTGNIYPNAYGFGIKAENNRIIGVSANGGAPSTLDLITGLAPLWTEFHLYEMIFTPLGQVEFYIDGVYKGKITTNLPTGQTDAQIPYKVNVKTGTGGVGHYILTSGFWMLIDL